MMYFHGIGTETDLSAALKWLRKASEQGYSPAQNQLAYAYEHGRGVPQDYAVAEKWYAAAAERGLPEAEHNIRVLRTFVQKLSRGMASQAETLTGTATQTPGKALTNSQ
jgi:TPR repeat protein